MVAARTQRGLKHSLSLEVDIEFDTEKEASAALDDAGVG
jgi:hypothetical protein